MNDKAHSSETKGTLVTGVIGEDVHIIGMRILEYVLREEGYKIVSLGAQVSQEEFIEAALETKADAIFVSSLGGHARILAPGLREKCMEDGLKDILLYLGGQLTIGEVTWEESENIFKNMGFDRVYPPNIELATVIGDLETDCRRGGVSA